MKIALITHTRVNGSLGGTELVFISMANLLAGKGHSVGCFYYDTTEGSPAYKIASNVFVKNCYSKLKLAVAKKTSKFRSWFISDKEEKRRIRNAPNQLIISEVKRFKADIVLLFVPNSILYDLNKLNAPVIQMIHRAPSFIGKFPFFKACKPAMEACACLQVLMPEHVSEMSAYVHNPNIVAIPNVVPQYDTQSDVTAHTIIFVGRIVEEKRPWLIVQAFSLLMDQYPDWKVELWGEEHESPRASKRVRDLVTQYGLEDRVLLCGTTKNIKEKLKAASIMIMTSAHEGFCLALTEGMSMGLPAVVCKDCKTFHSIVRNEQNGYLCVPTAEGIANKLSKLMSSQDLRRKLGAQAKEDMKQYSADVVYSKWMRLMSEVVNKHLHN